MSNDLWQGLTHPPLSLEAAVARLREKEGREELILERDIPLRVDSLQLESGSPCEDFTSYYKLDVGREVEWHFWGIFDGHAGWACAAVLNKALAQYVAHELRQMTGASDSETSAAIKRAFLRLDEGIIFEALKAINESESHAAILSHLAPAVSGSCALLAILDPASLTLRVASVGDSRAVLGRPDGRDWTTVALSDDQTPRNQAEKDRIISEHPNEPKLFDDKTGRMLGLPLTRAFGDHRWKWPVEETTKGCPKFYANPPRPNTLSPPYLTAEPVIESIKLMEGDVLILASDGIWDNMSSENAVKCISHWITAEQERVSYGGDSLTGTSDAHAESTIVEGRGKQMSPMAESWGWEWSYADLVIEDSNAATHLAKNALGGNRREQFLSVMSTHPPESRDARDDLTVKVLFFGGV